MPENPFGKEYLRGQLQKDFHAQFSRNQNHLQMMVIKVAAAFIVFFVIYILATLSQETYIRTYSRELKADYMYIVTNNFYYWLSVVISTALSMLTVYISQAGYALRRDQFIVQRIRDEYKLLDSTFKGYGKIFKGVFYLPDLYFILIIFITMVIIAVTIWTSFLLRLGLGQVVFLATPYLIVTLSYCLFFVKYKKNCRPDKVKIESLIEPATPLK